jgi:hypothetical protein
MAGDRGAGATPSFGLLCPAMTALFQAALGLFDFRFRHPVAAGPLLRGRFTIEFDGLADRRTGQPAQQRKAMIRGGLIGSAFFAMGRGAENERQADHRYFH